MVQHKATLIQNVTDYADMLMPLVRRALGFYNGPSVSEVEVLQWIIVEEFERIYYLYTGLHNRRQAPFEQLYQNVRRAISDKGIDLNQLTSFYIKAPRIYSDSDKVEINFVGRADLHITYYSSTQINTTFSGIR